MSILMLIGITIVSLVCGFAFAAMFGKASRLGRVNERASRREKKPLDIDTGLL